MVADNPNVKPPRRQEATEETGSVMQKWVKEGTGCRVAECASGIPGTYSYVFLHNSAPVPLGILWFNFCGCYRLNILGCYVDERVRRLGVFRRLVEAAVEAYPTVQIVITARASELAGPALKAMGFDVDGNGEWYRFYRHTAVVTDYQLEEAYSKYLALGMNGNTAHFYKSQGNSYAHLTRGEFNGKYSCDEAFRRYVDGASQ